MKIALDRSHGGAAPEGLLDFSASLNPLGPPREAIDAYHAAAKKIAAYPPAHPFELEAKFAERVGVTPSNVLAGNGSIQLIYLAARVMKARRAHVVIPTFSEIANGLALAGSEACSITLRAENNFKLDLSEIDAALETGTDAIWIGRPNSPTGAMLSDALIAAIADRCARNHARLVIDEAFIDFAARAKSVARLVSTHRVVVLRSLTKSFSIAGLRLGFVIAEPEFIGMLRDSIEPWSVNSAALAVGLACLDAPPEYLDRTREVVSRERDFLTRELSAIDGIRVFPSSANFLMFEVAHEPSPSAFAAQVLRHQIVVRDLAAMPGCRSGMYRVAVSMRADNECLVAAARDALARFRGP
ncbi:MAG TPA: histidinol-phosphate transaminase [Candidatus Binataceae bacterium]|nr:histidinol-phosphate transaminase [Candidatus Binataceae bacterium]